MATEQLNCNAFDSVHTEWTEAGASPYLNAADAATINTFTANFREGAFRFAATAILDFATITSIVLYLRMRTQDTDFDYVTVDDNLGADFNLFNSVNNEYEYISSANLLARFANLAAINAYEIDVVKKGAGGSITVDMAYLLITYTVAGGQQSKTLINELGY